MDAATVDGQPRREAVEQRPGEPHIVGSVDHRLAAAIAAIPGEDVLPRTRAGRIDDDGLPRRRECVEPAEPAHELRVRLAAVEGQHHRPAGERSGGVRHAGDRPPHPCSQRHVEGER